MIERIGVRELRNQVAAVLRRAGDGERPNSDPDCPLEKGHETGSL